MVIGAMLQAIKKPQLRGYATGNKKPRCYAGLQVYFMLTVA